MLRALFLPAIKLFNRFKYIQLITLLGSILTIPAMVAFSFYLAHVQNEIVEAKKGIIGIGYNQLLQEYLEDLQQYRAMSVTYLSGDRSFGHKLQEKKADIIQDIMQIDHYDQRFGNQLQTTAKWQEIKYRWYDLQSIDKSEDPYQNYLSLTDYYHDVLEYMTFLGDASGLSLDSEYVSFYLVNGIIKTVPELSETLGQIRAIGLITNKDSNHQLSYQLISMQSLLRSKLNDLEHEVKIIDRNLTSKHLSIITKHQLLQEKSKNIIDKIDQHINFLSRWEYYQLLTDTIEVCFSLYDSETTMLQEIYSDRVEKLMDQWYFLIGISVFILVFTMYGFIAFYLSVTETVRNIKSKSLAIVSGNLPMTTSLSMKEDLLDIGNTFNQITRNMHQQKISVMGQMAAGMAHEIRNPLTSIHGFTQFMKKGIEEGSMEPETFLQYLNICQEEIKAIENLVANFLILARKNEEATIEIRPVHLQTVLNRVHELSKHFVIEKDVFLTFRYDDENSWVNGVGTHIEQIALNLVKNAIDAVPAGGKVSLRTSIDQRLDQAIISIQDNGSGIPAERMKHLFEPFYTTKEKGTGIGLSVCKKLLDEMDGNITIYSEEGFGTTVTFRLLLTSPE
ncbi:sensor histidine kinase [Brevibacillus sp. SYSU BS000544]|uniref:sensor histidine kinase n=1 Tax=Brevibacillus sp. SYSU BS000544 TaxID=3416443 RepID=UPI003CE44FB7